MVLYSTNHPRYEENRYTDFILLNNTTSGSITSIGSEEVGIGGTKYKLSELVNELPETSLGDAVKVYLDAKGNVIYMEASGYDYKASKYALYLGIDKVKGGSNPRWEISLYTQDSAIADLMIAEKISINGGSKIKTSDASVESFFAGLDSEEMIKFKTKDGELTEIFTADDWGSEYRYWDFGNGFNRYEAGNPWWRTDAGGMFSAWLPVASDALRFVIVHDANGNIVEEKSVVTTTKPIGDQRVNNLVLWDIDKNGKAHAYICSPNTENVSKGGGTVNNDFLVVTSVVDAANEEGVPGKYVFGIKQADEVEYFLSSENYAACGITETTNPVKAGNVIKIVTSGSEIVGLVKNSKNSGSNFIYFTKAELDEPAVTLSNAIAGRSYEFAAPEVKKSYSLFAKIVFVRDDLVYFVCADTAGVLGKAQITDPNTCFCTKKSGTVYRYDSEGKKLFNVVSWNDVQSSSNLTGSADDVIDGSTVLVNVNNGTVTDIVILD